MFFMGALGKSGNFGLLCSSSGKFLPETVMWPTVMANQKISLNTEAIVTGGEIGQPDQTHTASKRYKIFSFLSHSTMPHLLAVTSSFYVTCCHICSFVQNILCPKLPVFPPSWAAGAKEENVLDYFKPFDHSPHNYFSKIVWPMSHTLDYIMFQNESLDW